MAFKKRGRPAKTSSQDFELLDISSEKEVPTGQPKEVVRKVTYAPDESVMQHFSEAIAHLHGKIKKLKATTRAAAIRKEPAPSNSQSDLHRQILMRF